MWAGLEQRDRVLVMEVAGESREVSVESYEHFGEWAYRLRLVPTRKRRRTYPAAGISYKNTSSRNNSRNQVTGVES
jgi:hypothetical protein